MTSLTKNGVPVAGKGRHLVKSSFQEHETCMQTIQSTYMYTFFFLHSQVFLHNKLHIKYTGTFIWAVRLPRDMTAV